MPESLSLTLNVLSIPIIYRSNHWRCSVKKGIPKNFAKFVGKCLYWSLFFCNFIKKETPTQVFSYEFSEIFKNIFFTKHLRATASAYRNETQLICTASGLTCFYTMGTLVLNGLRFRNHDNT